jgi:hypothetical protein
MPGLAPVIAQESLPLLEQGAVQFIVFGLMVFGIYLFMKITISK